MGGVSGGGGGRVEIRKTEKGQSDATRGLGCTATKRSTIKTKLLSFTSLMLLIATDKDHFTCKRHLDAFLLVTQTVVLFLRLPSSFPSEAL